MKVSTREADLRAAAQALATWAHARRATWTSAPLPRVAPPRAAEPIVQPRPPEPAPPSRTPPVPPRIVVEPVIARSPEPMIARTPDAPAPAAPSAFSSGIKIELTPLAAPARSSTPTFDRDNDWVASTRPRPAAPEPETSSVGRWLLWGGLAVGAGAAIVIGAPRLWKPTSSAAVASSSPAPHAKPDAESTVPSGSSRAGALHVASTPDGARVLVDGKDRGVTPLAIAQIPAGRHEVTIESSAGTIRRTVTVTANQTATIEESIFSGWTIVYAPFEVVVSEGGRVLTPDERNQMMLPPGTHQLRITNRALAYDTVQTVDIKPGETTTVRLAPQPTMLTVTASEPAEVWVDGARFGDTPLQSAPVSLGTHQIVVKRAAGGEKRMTITAGTSPITLNVDFR